VRGILYKRERERGKLRVQVCPLNRVEAFLMKKNLEKVKDSVEGCHEVPGGA
jgi:hypothetical protein